ncbi:MAG: hypothetical protein U0531_05395 [Dehalococcoidia bacterium]
MRRSARRRASNRVLTYHFRDKDDILLSLIERIAPQVQAELLAVSGERRPRGYVRRAAAHRRPPATAPPGRLFRLLLYFLSQAMYRAEVAERVRSILGESIHLRFAGGVIHAQAAGRLTAGGGDRRRRHPGERAGRAGDAGGRRRRDSRAQTTRMMGSYLQGAVAGDGRSTGGAQAIAGLHRHRTGA